MAKRKRKTYKRYSVNAFLSGFLCFGIAGLVVAILFTPMFAYKHGSDPVVIYNGLDYLLFGLRIVIPSEGRFDSFLSYFQAYIDGGGSSYLLKPIAQFHAYIEIGFVAFFALAVVFAVIEAILGIFWIFTGRLLLPKSSKSLAWIITVFFWVSFGFFIGYLYIYAAIIKEVGEAVSFNLSINPFLFGGALVLVTIILSIIYTAGYKNRKFAKKVKPVYDDDEEEIKEPKPEPKKKNVVSNNEVVEPEPVKEEAEVLPEPPTKALPEPEPEPPTWTCSYCGSINTSKFCTECGQQKPEEEKPAEDK